MFEKRRIKSRLMNAFHIAQITYKSTLNGNVLYDFPQILDIRKGSDKDVYVFKLPFGVDPKELYKQSHVFESMFGNVEFKGNSTISMTVHHQTFPDKVIYNLEEMDINKYKLPVIAGMNRYGEYIGYDMVKNPNLLIGGEIGGGKSTQLRQIVTTWITGMSENRIHLYLNDPKFSELNIFAHCKHVKSFGTNENDLSQVLNLINNEMDHRKKLLLEHEVQHIDELPKKHHYVVLVVDEFGAYVGEKHIMDDIVQITQLGRALGVFVVLATQRPDKDTVNGRIKNSLPMRMAFMLPDKVNSRIVLDNDMASKLDAPGRLIFKDKSKYEELQAPLLEAETAKQLIQPFKEYKEVVAEVEEIDELTMLE